MTEAKTFFARAVDALLESRMRQANHQVALYQQSIEADVPKKGR